SSTEARADAIRYSMIADASAYLERKWKYIAPLVTSASARMSSRLTRLYDLRANWREAARRICTRVVSARLSRCSVTSGPRNLDSGAGGQPIAVAVIDQSSHSFTPGPQNADAPILLRKPRQRPSSMRPACGSRANRSANTQSHV